MVERARIFLRFQRTLIDQQSVKLALISEDEWLQILSLKVTCPLVRQDLGLRLLRSFHPLSVLRVASKISQIFGLGKTFLLNSFLGKTVVILGRVQRLLHKASTVTHNVMAEVENGFTKAYSFSEFLYVHARRLKLWVSYCIYQTGHLKLQLTKLEL